ncbi:hypothetical protein Tco_0323062 [Tanacetum coccineum]
MYALRKLNIYEKNYTTHGLELGAMVFTLKIWKHVLVTRSPVLWAEIGEIWSIGPELVQQTTNKEYWMDADMHVPLEEIKVHRALRFVENPVEIKDREDFMKTKCPHMLTGRP